MDTFNRTLLELKSDNPSYGGWFNSSFNRTLLELKSV